MIRDIMLIYCNENEEVVEVESYTENNGAIISLKKSQTLPAPQPFDLFSRQLSEQNWQIELAGVNHLGHNRPDTKNYVAHRPHQG